MVTRRRNTATTQTLRRSRQTCFGSGSGFSERNQSQPLLLQFLGATRQALAVDARRDHKEGLRGHMGPYTPLRCVDVEP